MYYKISHFPVGIYHRKGLSHRVYRLKTRAHKIAREALELNHFPVLELISKTKKTHTGLLKNKKVDHTELTGLEIFLDSR